MVLYQVCSNEGPGDQDGPLPEGLRCEPLKYIEKYIKIFFFRTTWLRCLKLGIKHCLVVLYQDFPNEGPRFEDGPTPGGLRFKP